MNTGCPIPKRTLLVLTVAVLVAHLWLLRSAPGRIQFGDAVRAVPFSTRSVSSVPVPARPAAAAPPVEPVLPKRMTAHAPGRSRVTAAAPAAPAAPAIPARLTPAEPEPAARKFVVPRPMNLHYAVTVQVKSERTQGSSELSWEQDGETYEARMETRATGLPPRIQLSSGRITAEGLAPLRFSEKTRTEQAAHFEREAQRLSFSNNRPATALLAGAQDRLSVLLQLGAMMAGEPHGFPVGTTVLIQTATTRDAEPWAFTVEGAEPMELPGGSVPTVKLVRPPKREFDQRIEVWLAPGLDYVPVRLRLTQPNGDWVDQQWSSTDRR